MRSDLAEEAISFAVESTPAGIAFALFTLLNSAGIGYPGFFGFGLLTSFAVSLEFRARPGAHARVGELADLSRLLVRWSTVRLVSWLILGGSDVNWLRERSSRHR